MRRCADASGSAARRRLFDRFRGTYNDDRPHEALGQKTPASRYVSSHRPFPDSLRAPTYPETMKLRRVDGSGRFTFLGVHTLTTTLAGQPVGLEPIDEDTWELFYGPCCSAPFTSATARRDSIVRLRTVPRP